MHSWEQRKLGDNIVEYTEKTTENNQYPVLTSSRKGIFFQTDYYDGNQIASADNTGYNIVPYGYFTYRHMSDDEIFHFNINDIAENGIVSTLYPVFTTDENLDSRYLQYQLNYGREFARYAILQKQGGSRTYMYLNKLRNLYLTVPTAIEEQKKISEYFTNLDHLITLHQRKYDETKTLKKYMLQKMFPQNGEKVPEIRFDGFTEDWEQRKLGDNIVEYTEKTTENNQYPVLTSSRKGIFFQTDYYDGNQIASADNTGYNIVPYGYFTYRHMSDDEIFHFNINDIAENGIVSTLYPVFTTDENLDSRYLQYQLNYGREFARYAILQKQGGSRTYMYLNKLRNLYLTVPTAIEEQKKISEYFTNLDHLITLHQRKYDETKTLKKYMLQKMFPQNGEKVPEIRFDGFTEDWEQRKLGDITVKIGSGKTPSGGKSAYVETGIPLIRSQNVNGDKVDFADIVFVDETTDESMANSRVYTNDVLLNITGASIGRSAVYKGLESANVNQHVCIIRPTEGYQPDFIQLNLSSDNGQKQIDASQAGGGREGLNFQEIGKMQFCFPSLNEQKCIGRYFNSLDHFITLHQRKCDELRSVKKFMLQNMFI